jgi:hypothetical protein
MGQQSMSTVNVRFQPTPNPNAGKFTIVNRRVVGGGSRSYSSPEQAAGDPVAEALFAVPGVAGLFMVSDFITVMKSPDADWSDLVPVVTTAIERAMT